MKATFVAILASIAAAAAIPAPVPAAEAQQGAPAWFPDVYQCRCTDGTKSIVQPICKQAAGTDLTIYPPQPPLPDFGRYEWCSKTATKSAQRTNRLAPFFTDAACKQFGSSFTAKCELAGYTLCFGEEECS